MASEEDILFRPILHGMYQFESLKNGAIDLIDVVKCNEAIDVKLMNESNRRKQ